MNWLFSLLFCVQIMPGIAYDSKRHVFVFGDPKSQAVMEQVQLLKNGSSGLRERDIVVTIVGRDSSLNNKYRVDVDSFVVILIGKDGGEKYRTIKLLSLAELFAIVDSMPMRKAEMRRRD